MTSLQDNSALGGGRGPLALPLAWWWRRLALTLDAVLPRARRRARLVASSDAEGLLLSVEGRGKPNSLRLSAKDAQEPAAISKALAQLRAGRLPVVGRLGAGESLTRRVSLPPAAQENLRAVLSHQIDRLTPWSAGQAAFDAQPAPKGDPPNAKGDLDFVLAAAPKAKVQRLQQGLERFGLTPQRIEPAPGPLTAGLIFDLAREREVRPRAAERLLMLMALLLFAGFLAGLGWLGYTYVKAQDQRADLALKSETAALRAEAVARERAELIALRDERSYLLEKKRSSPSALLLLEELSRLLPDGTWLSLVALEGREVTLSGFSDNASALIPLLEASPDFADAAFGASTRSDDQTGKERFQITLKLGPQAEGQEGEPRP